MFRGCLAAAVLGCSVLSAQVPSTATGGVRAAADSQMLTAGFHLVNSEAVDRARFEQLTAGVPTGRSLLLRSASTLMPAGTTDAAGISFIAPQFLVVSNSDIPFSQNDGALWAGKGLSTRTLTGFVAGNARLRVIVAPELLITDNAKWVLRKPGFYAPPVPKDRSGGGFVFPYYIGPFSIDQPMRLGPDRIRRLDPGQSSVTLSGSRIAVGFSIENEWWGPGIRNALVLSNNAAGFPHVVLRSARPLSTRFGDVEFRWLAGGLRESRYFDTVSTNNVRSIASLAATIQTRWDPNLSFGLARSVYATASGWGQTFTRPLDVFASTHSPANRPFGDSTLSPGGRDQIFSLFARWVLPADGVELYTEWARTEFPTSLRDFLTAPNHTQGYTLGFQWRGPSWREGNFRIHSEVTQLEQSATFRDRPVGSWYTSRRVIQGYTNRGEILGAAIGPGASSQWLAIDYLRANWRLGAFAGRIRWNEDVHDTANFPIYVGYCIHDVSIYSGLRAAKAGRFGSFTADMTFQNRMNAFFQNGGGCPNNGARVDIRNTTLSLTLATFTHR